MGNYVKKPFISLILMICILLQVTGCGRVQILINETDVLGSEILDTGIQGTETKNTETTLQPIENKIREIAYQDFDKNVKKIITDLRTSEVEAYESLNNNTILSQNGLLNIKDIDTYRVLFENISDYVELGPITVYVDENTYTVLGYGLRK